MHGGLMCAGAADLIVCLETLREKQHKSEEESALCVSDAFAQYTHRVSGYVRDILETFDEFRAEFRSGGLEYTAESTLDERWIEKKQPVNCTAFYMLPVVLLLSLPPSSELLQDCRRREINNMSLQFVHQIHEFGSTGWLHDGEAYYGFKYDFGGLGPDGWPAGLPENIEHGYAVCWFLDALRRSRPRSLLTDDVRDSLHDDMRGFARSFWRYMCVGSNDKGFGLATFFPLDCTKRLTNDGEHVVERPSPDLDDISKKWIPLLPLYLPLARWSPQLSAFCKAVLRESQLSHVLQGKAVSYGHVLAWLQSEEG